MEGVYTQSKTTLTINYVAIKQVISLTSFLHNMLFCKKKKKKTVIIYINVMPAAQYNCD